MMRRTHRGMLAAAGAVAVVASLLSPPGAAYAEPKTEPTVAAAPANTDTLTTWTHANAVATSEPIAGDQVRRSQFYDASVTPAQGRKTAYESFVYMSVPRGGKDKIGYTEEDGAEFTSKADYTMSWSSFEYAKDVWVNVTLKTGQTITSADQVTIRPTDLGLKKQLVNRSTVAGEGPLQQGRLPVLGRVRPAAGHRVQRPQRRQRHAHHRGGRQPRRPHRAAELHADLRQPEALGEAGQTAHPHQEVGLHLPPAPGLVNNLDDITEEIIYFEPGTYYMGSDYHAVLPAERQVGLPRARRVREGRLPVSG